MKLAPGLRVGACISSMMLLAEPVESQTPMGHEFRVNQRTADYQGDVERPAVDNAGNFAVLWDGARTRTVGGVQQRFQVALGRFFDSAGRPLTGEVHLARAEERLSSAVGIVAGATGDYLTLWYEGTGSRTYPDFEYLLRTYTTLGVPESERFRRPPLEPEGELIYQVEPSPSGEAWLLWGARRGDVESGEVLACRMNAEGELLGQPTSLALDLEQRVEAGGIGLDAQSRPVVEWSEDCGPDPYVYLCNVYAQRLSPVGEKLGAPTRLNQVTEGGQLGAGVGVAPDGSFLAVWQDTKTPYPWAVLGRHFSAALEPTGDEFLISAGDPSTYPVQPHVATDSAGRAFVVWGNFRPDAYGRWGWDIIGRAFAPDGHEITRGPRRLNQLHAAVEYPNAWVSFGGNGTFVAAWESLDADWNGVFAQRFAFWPGDEACVRRGTEVLCDTGRRGGDAEFQIDGLGLATDGTLLFGDVDGDGRADPCVRRGSRIACDTDHFGAPFEVAIDFGSGDRRETAFLGDVDGDSIAEVCVRSGSTWACDTHHDGGRAELRFVYGAANERGLMGDVDGDGRADGCVVRHRRLHCDAGHGRPGRELVLDFPAGTDPRAGFLGDFDGDGRADPCGFRDGSFVCYTAHDGSAIGTLRFGEAGDQPILANLDGF